MAYFARLDELTAHLLPLFSIALGMGPRYFSEHAAFNPPNPTLRLLEYPSQDPNEPNLFGIGLGALGSDYEECRSRFGEWMMVDGAVAYLPSDRAAVPDYAAGAGAYHPVSQMLYGLCWEGQPAWQFRFDAQEPRRVVSLSEILQQLQSPRREGG